MAKEYTSLYVKRKKIHPLLVDGPFQTLRRITILLTVSFYFLLPWMNWNDRQAILFDLPGRKFYALGFTFWPQDFFLLSWLLIIAALTLFLMTVFAGRLWCGYTCPQTVWTNLFMRIEQWVEGGRSKRFKLDKMPLSFYKVSRRLIKYALWLLLAFATAITFVGFFSPIRDLLFNFFSFKAHFWEVFWICFFCLATYINAGWMREQVCLYMCPYARFQSVMFDKDTLIISYDHERGEKRGPRRRIADPKSLGLGDCINCFQCVHACPTGIDIRDGLQIECIGCAACIDACNNVMEKIGYEKNLIKYTSQRVVDEKGVSSLFRPRTVAYGVILIAMLGFFTYCLFSRSLLDVDIIRDRNQLYRVLDDGQVENVYRIKIMNKSQKKQRYQITVVQADRYKYVGENTVTLQAGELLMVPIRIQAPLGEQKEKSKAIRISVASLDRTDVFLEETRFIVP